MAPTYRSSLAGVIDSMLVAADEALRALSGAATAGRPSPGAGQEGPAGAADRDRAARLMRVNHTGEVCAQALYSGQALVARSPSVRSALRTAASEERDHLAWCRDRLRQLDSRASLLDPLWYAGSFAWGLASGLAGDRWSLGFLAETEDQVERHLEGHLDRLPADDRASRAIVAQMRDDEARHGAMGRALGAAELPAPVKAAMRAAARVMTRTTYWV
ncbi:MAG TPA: 2-polyprenyl-3-methyl-6-methoxy-1,4-benzoquinone monooxygenase [Usitatibacter sp.]|nr:2-polyprenyl-3-methyl-6-methoxy-1,4-benzoquinone monooxygenase [Usitatibacter sp.]